MKNRLFAIVALYLMAAPTVPPSFAGGLVPIIHPEFGNAAERIATGYVPNVLDYLNEVSGRRRLTTLFPNEQSPFYGNQMNFVNVRKGNLTFAIRDLVRIDNMPIVFGRVYDSSLTEPSDFGVGWKLSVAETISTSGSVLAYTDSNNSRFELIREGTSIRSPYAHLSGISGGRFSGSTIEIETQGLTKVFQSSGSEYNLTEVRGANGASISLHYSASGVDRIQSSGGRIVVLHRDDAGRVVGARDDAGRTVSFRYDSRGLLTEVTDLAEGNWLFNYDEHGQLQNMQDPRGISNLTAAFDASGRAVQVISQHDTVSYEYGPSITTVRNAMQQAAVFSHHLSGLTMAVQDFAGSVSELSLDGDLRVIGLMIDGANMAYITYQGGQVSTVDQNVDGQMLLSEFEYDVEGRLISVGNQAGVIARYAYGSDGSVSQAEDSAGRREYRYSSNGRLSGVSVDDNIDVRLHMDDLGRIDRFSWADEAWAALAYDRYDRVAELRINKGGKLYASRYDYDPRGLRSKVNFLPPGRDEPIEMSIQYDEVGNAIQLDHPIGTAGEVMSDRYTLGTQNQVLSTAGDGLRPEWAFEYDQTGRLMRVTAGIREAEFSYDDLGRLSDAYLDKRHMITSDYGPMDLDPVLEADARSGLTFTGQAITSHVFGTPESVIYSRSIGSPFGPIQFVQSMARYVIRKDIVSAPDEILLASLKRRILLSENGADAQPMLGFDKASNSLFVPREFYSANCFSCVDWVSNFSLTRVGSGPVDVGEQVTFDADAGASVCYFSVYDEEWGEWEDFPRRFYHYVDFDDGNTPLFTGPYGYSDHAYMQFSHSFSAPGDYIVSDDIVCQCSYIFLDVDTESVCVKPQFDAPEDAEPPAPTHVSIIAGAWGNAHVEYVPDLMCTPVCDGKYRLDGDFDVTSSITIQTDMEAYGMCTATTREASNISNSEAHELIHANAYLDVINEFKGYLGIEYVDEDTCEAARITTMAVLFTEFDAEGNRQDNHEDHQGWRRHKEHCPVAPGPTVEGVCGLTVTCPDPPGDFYYNP